MTKLATGITSSTPARKSRLLVLAAIAASLPFGYAAAQPPTTDANARATTLYAAPHAHGTQCVRTDPCDLARSRMRVRSILATHGRTATINVLLASGVYHLTAPLTFGPQDSGSAAHPVRWMAAPGAKPVISGATAVTHWRLADAAKHIWAAHVPAASRTRQLYVNGKQVRMATISPRAEKLTFTPATGGYTVAPAAWAKKLTDEVDAQDIKRIEFVFTGANGAWTQSFCQVAAIDGAHITMQQPCWGNVIHRVQFRDATGGLPAMPTDRQPTMIRNAYPFLQPGQWYLDTASDTLYYRTTKGQVMSRLDIELPHLQTLVQGVGTAAAPVQNIVFSGITFAYATWLGPSSNAGFADVQDNLRLTLGKKSPPQAMCQFSTPRGTCPFGALTREPGNVSFHRATHIVLENDVFTHLGAAGVVFDGGSKKNVVKGNIFTDIAGNAIILGNTTHPHPQPGFINTGNVISNNVIYAIGSDYPSAAAITLFFSRHTRVSHNDIHDVPYDGITAGVIQGHVDNAEHPDNSTNINADNVISHNLIHGFMRDLHDGGAIYIEGHQGQGGPQPHAAKNWKRYVQAGLRVTGNVAYHQGHANYTWYDDAGAQWIDFSSNVEWGHKKGGGEGGCQPTGDIRYVGNYGAHPIGHWSCTPPAPTFVTFAHNHAIPMHPALRDLPLEILRKAGPVGKYRQLAAATAPHVAYVHVNTVAGQSAPNVLIAGAGFVPHRTTVRFGSGKTVAATVLNNGMLVVTAPTGVNPCQFDVRTPAGDAAGACKGKPVAFWTKPTAKQKVQ